MVIPTLFVDIAKAIIYTDRANDCRVKCSLLTNIREDDKSTFKILVENHSTSSHNHTSIICTVHLTERLDLAVYCHKEYMLAGLDFVVDHPVILSMHDPMLESKYTDLIAQLIKHRDLLYATKRDTVQ